MLYGFIVVKVDVIVMVVVLVVKVLVVLNCRVVFRVFRVSYLVVFIVLFFVDVDIGFF